MESKGQRRFRWFSSIIVFLSLCLPAGAQQRLTDTVGAKADTASASSSVRQVPLPAEYMVGASDVLHVDVWQEPEISGNVVVRPDGNISLPLINEVKVSGMTPLQIQYQIGLKLTAFVNNPKVTVTVVEIHSKRAFITGEVSHPGEYSLNTQVTVLQLIAQAGGFTPFAKTERIVVLRTVNGQQQRLHFKYREVVRGKDIEQNINLQSGDTVVVP